MTNDELKSWCLEMDPSISWEDGTQWLTAQVQTNSFRPLLLQLYLNENLKFNYLFCLTCVDWKTHFSMVYHLTSTEHRIPLVVKVKLERVDPEIETVSDIWRTADFLEREVYDLFGIRFLNHPDLRRLIMPDDREGWPLRKDYEDPINMIKL